MHICENNSLNLLLSLFSYMRMEDEKKIVKNIQKIIFEAKFYRFISLMLMVCGS